MTLPTQKTKPNRALERQSIIIYGAPKIGKTSFAAQFDRPLFIATEDGHNDVEVYREKVSDWKGFISLCKEIAEYKGDLYKTIVIDVVDNLYEFCTEHILKVNNMQHGSDQDNKGYQLVNAEMMRVLKKIALLDYGIIFISHEKQKTIKTRTGKIEKATVSLPSKLEGFLIGMCDMILYFETIETTSPEGVKGEARVIKTVPSNAYEAGGRIHGLKDEISMGNSPKEAYNEFIKEYKKAISAKGEAK